MKRFLILCDGSYVLYTILFGAAREFIETKPNVASQWIKPVDECDQDNLPNLLNCDEFRKILKKFTMRRLESIDNIAKDNFQDEMNEADVIDIVFAMDDKLSHSFRKDMYPEYKAQRTLVKRQYQIQPIKDYIVDVLFKELDVHGQYGYNVIKVEGAEGDDVIATTIIRKKNDYIGMMLIASDHDFLQIDGLREFDMFGKEAKRDLGGEIVSANDYLLGKILMGDKSDNIKQVFTRCGPKTALKWTKDRESLKKVLSEDHALASRYLLNKKMISFEHIPIELSDKILKHVNEALHKEVVLNKHKMNDWSSFMTL